ncbi:MAG: response regulator [Deltaproteobacteria bacterium]|nr:response regulator [Deltaproteobacteria bacterium]MBW2072001.1 response regulator [Deltaproteobacteria bacterium]
MQQRNCGAHEVEVVAAKVLIVDDERAIRELFYSFFSAEGFQVILASEGLEALALAEKECPQVILLDVKMPGMSGIEVCHRLKANEKTSAIPIIIMTAYLNRTEEAMEAGAHDFISKPVNLEELAARVNSVIEQAS